MLSDLMCGKQNGTALWVKGRKQLSERFTAEYIRSRLSYSPETGDIIWKLHDGASRRWATRWAGKRAGCAKVEGRVFVQIDGRSVGAAVIAWVIMTGEWPQKIVDHRDGDPSNDRWDNLRLATPSENLRNMKRSASNTSGIKGVSFSKPHGKWRSAIVVSGETIFLGLHETKEAAGVAYADAAERLFGEFARVA